MCLAPGQISTFAQQLKSFGSTAQIFGCMTLDNQAEVIAARGALQGAWFVTSGVTPEFRQKYRGRFGSEDFIGGAAIMYELGEQLSSLCSVEPKKSRFPENLLQLLLAKPSTGKATQLTPTIIDGDRYLGPPLTVGIVE